MAPSHRNSGNNGNIIAPTVAVGKADSNTNSNNNSTTPQPRRNHHKRPVALIFAAAALLAWSQSSVSSSTQMLSRNLALLPSISSSMMTTGEEEKTSSSSSNPQPQQQQQQQQRQLRTHQQQQEENENGDEGSGTTTDKTQTEERQKETTETNNSHDSQQHNTQHHSQDHHQKFYSIMVKPEEVEIKQACWLIQNIEYLERMQPLEQDDGNTANDNGNENENNEVMAAVQRRRRLLATTNVTLQEKKPLIAVFVVNTTMDEHHQPRYDLKHMLNYWDPGVKLWQRKELAKYSRDDSDSGGSDNDNNKDKQEQGEDLEKSNTEKNPASDHNNENENKPPALGNDKDNNGATATARRRLSETTTTTTTTKKDTPKSNADDTSFSDKAYWHEQRFQQKQHYGTTPMTEWVQSELERLCGQDSTYVHQNDHYKGNLPKKDDTPKHLKFPTFVKENANRPIDMTRLRIRELALFPIQFGPKQEKGEDKVPMPMRKWSMTFQQLRLFDPILYRGLEEGDVKTTAVPPPPHKDDTNPNAPDISVLHLSKDLLLRKDISHLLELKRPAIVGWESSKHRQYSTESSANTGVMLIRPNAKDYQSFVQKAEYLARPDSPGKFPWVLGQYNTSKIYKMEHDPKLLRKMRKKGITEFPKVHMEGLGSGGLTEEELQINVWRHHELWKYRQVILDHGAQSFLHWATDGFPVPKYLHLGPTYNLILVYCQVAAHEALRQDYTMVLSAPKHRFWQRERGYRRTPCIGQYNDEWHDLHPGVNHHKYRTIKKKKKDHKPAHRPVSERGTRRHRREAAEAAAKKNMK